MAEAARKDDRAYPPHIEGEAKGRMEKCRHRNRRKDMKKNLGYWESKGQQEWP
jgi:hypothetical protein